MIRFHIARCPGQSNRNIWLMLYYSSSIYYLFELICTMKNPNLRITLLKSYRFLCTPTVLSKRTGRTNCPSQSTK